jgi:AraC family transcriptional regulator
MIAGVERYTENGIPSIREAWEEFDKRYKEIPNAVNDSQCYGFEDYSRDFDMNKGGFPKYYYIASLEVTDITNLPEGIKGREVPAADYAVFTHQGSIAALPQVFGEIYGKWMPASGYKVDPAVSADFEFYPESVTDHENALVEIWVPIVKA